MNAQEREKRDQETHDTVNIIKAILLGANGDDGLVGDVKEQHTVQMEQGKSINKLSRNFWLLIGVLVGSGVLVGGINLFVQ